MNKTNAKILYAGLAIILLTNVVALGGVAYNRSGEPDAVIEFTERELRMPYRYRFHKENTGFALDLQCRIESQLAGYHYGNTNCWGYPLWLDKDKLIELGFDFVRDAAAAIDNRNRYQPRSVYLVLEYDGEAYQRVLAAVQAKLVEEKKLLSNNPGDKEFEKRTEDAVERLKFEHHHNSRLFAIDAGLDKQALRQRYAERSRYILVQALVKADPQFDKEKWFWAGSINDLLIKQVNIPLAHRGVFKSLEVDVNSSYRQADLPRYQVRVAYGKRNEPWVLDALSLVTNTSD